VTGIRLLGVIAALFAAALIVLPGVRISQGRLTARRAAGLWISGFGFLLLALAAFGVGGARTRAFLLLGIVATVFGNMAQRRWGGS